MALRPTLLSTPPRQPVTTGIKAFNNLNTMSIASKPVSIFDSVPKPASTTGCTASAGSSGGSDLSVVA